MPGAATVEVVFKFPPRVELVAPVASTVGAAPLVLVDAPRDPSRGPASVGLRGRGRRAGRRGRRYALAFDGMFAANDARANALAATTASPPAMSDLTKYEQASRAHDDAKTRNELGWTMVGIGGPRSSRAPRS